MVGALATFARNLGLQDVVPMLEDTLKEEKAADGKLTQIAETVMNQRAARHQVA